MERAKIIEMAKRAVGHIDPVLRDQAIDQIGGIISTYRTGVLTYTTPAGRQARDITETVEKWAAAAQPKRSRAKSD